VVYKGEFEVLQQKLGSGYEIITHNESDRVNELTVKYLNGDTHNDLLMKIAENAQVVSYQERIPSMNEVFIQEVESNN
jgi:ABC-2 type transport system ATP-binding protein